MLLALGRESLLGHAIIFKAKEGLLPVYKTKTNQKASKKTTSESDTTSVQGKGRAWGQRNVVSVVAARSNTRVQRKNIFLENSSDQDVHRHGRFL